MLGKAFMLGLTKKLALPIAAALLALTASAASAATLDAVKQRGSLSCGVSQGLAAFSDHDAGGKWSGFDVDFCRAVAAAIFDNPTKVTFTPLNASERFEALRSGKVDLLSRNSTWTFDREASLGVIFAAITYHDGQGFMVLRKPEITSALELDKASICVQKGTTSELNLSDYFRANSMTYTPMRSTRSRRWKRRWKAATAACSPPTNPRSMPSASTCQSPTPPSSCPT
jgi:general L-amino acid transport system substrate-binding protein